MLGIKHSTVALVLSTGLVACGGGANGDGGSINCEFVGGSAIAGMSVGGSSNVQDAVDRNLSTFATISSIVDGQFIARGGSTVNGGGNAGLFVTPPSGTTAIEVTVNTRMGQAIVESATGPALDITDVSNTPATTYIGFDTSLPYDGIEFLFTGGGEYLIYEFCHSANLN